MVAQLVAVVGWRLPVPWGNLVIVLGFAGLGLLVGNMLFRKRRLQPAPAAAVPPAQTAPPSQPAQSAATANQRESVRLSGTWFKVVLMDAQAGGPFFEGHVIDFTPSGLGLMLFQEVRAGKVLSARHAKAPATVPWVHLHVRSCQQLEKTVWKVGCHVEDPTLWNTLLQYN